jgi:hypothetical protein
MHHLALLLVLAATSSAIDVYLYTFADCTDEYSVYVNVNPNVCLGPASEDYYSSIAFRAIPRQWSLDVRAHQGGACHHGTPYSRLISNTESYCHQLSNVRWSGAGYSIRGAKRDVDVFKDTCSAGVGGECTPQRPNRMGTGDGTEYNLDDMDDETYNAMVSIA